MFSERVFAMQKLSLCLNTYLRGMTHEVICWFIFDCFHHILSFDLPKR